MSKLIFFGNEQLAQGVKYHTPIFDALLASPHEICALVLPDAHTRKPFAVAQLAKQHHIPIHYVHRGKDLLPIIQQYQPDLGVLAAFGKLVPDDAINAIPCGIINIHPSLLPKYRGTTPIESPLLNGDTQTGVSVMRLVKEMDAGPILTQATVAITSETTKQSLYDQLSTLGAQLISDVLDGVLTKTTPETPQDDAGATFTAKLDKNMSELKFAEKAAQTLCNEVRAFAGFPKSKTTLLGIPCTITAAHVAAAPATELDQRCADGRYFIIDRLLPENSKEMDVKSFLNGHRH